MKRYIVRKFCGIIHIKTLLCLNFSVFSLSEKLRFLSLLVQTQA